MTSGIFHTGLIDEIKIKRGERQRRVLTGIAELADSISRIGLLHPIVVTRDHTLVAGERRLAAFKALGRTHIPYQFTDEVDPAALRLLELEENVRRVDISWQEQAAATAEYHALRAAATPEWEQVDTAKALGQTPGHVGRLLAVAGELAKPESKIAAAPKLSTAIGMVERARSRAQDSEIAGALAEAGLSPEAAPAERRDILCADFREWATGYAGPRFNLIHCDFPYGINAESRQQGVSTLTQGSYADSEEIYWELCRTLVDNINHIATDQCHILFWFSMRFYRETRDFFAEHSDFVLDPFPLIWLKSDNVGLLPDPERGPRRIYETAFLGQRGDRKIVRAVSNAHAAPTSRQIHMSEKPVPVLSHFFRMLVDPTSRVLDPTCGSGSAIRAADALGAAAVLGLELNPEFARLAGEALAKERKLRRTENVKADG